MNWGDERLPERFWAKVMPEPNSSCWFWLASLTDRGYGVWKWKGRCRVHRITYVAFVGEVPAGLELDHLCRNRGCCNPAHLEAVTHLENMRRVAATKTHCPRGHAYDGANTYTYTGGGQGTYRQRTCRACNAMFSAVYRNKRKALNANAQTL